MKPSLPNSPAKLVLVALFGGLASASSFLVIAPAHRFSPGSISPLLWFFAFLGMFSAGFVLEFNAESKIRNGIATERWTASELSSARRAFPIQFVVPIALALVAVALILLTIHPHRNGFVWPFILLSQSLSRIVTALKEPRPSVPPPDWRTFSPIHSDQWGHR